MIKICAYLGMAYGVLLLGCSPIQSSDPAADPAPSPPATTTDPPSPTPQAKSSALPTPPANAQVIDHIQNTTDHWSSCSPCAQGRNNTTNFWMAPFQTSPSMSGSSRQIFIDGPPWTNALFSKVIPGKTGASHFLWEFSVFMDKTTVKSIWAAEFDLWQVVHRSQFMIGSQCNFGNHVWDIWDTKHNNWIASGIPCQRWAAETWHHIQWYVERLPSGQYRYNTLVVDGKAHNLNRVFEVTTRDWQNAIGVQWQLDQSSDGVRLNEWIDNVRLTIW